MPNMVCAKCECELKPKSNDVRVVEYFLKPPKPYKIWCADLWVCPKCGVEIVSGFGFKSLSEHYETTFQDTLSDSISNHKVINDYEIGG